MHPHPPPILPPTLQDLRSISLRVATAVALAAVEGGLAQKEGLPQDEEGMEEVVAAAMWSPGGDTASGSGN